MLIFYGFEMKIRNILVMALALLPFYFSDTSAEVEKYVKATARADREVIKKGEEFRILLKLSIADYWYTYDIKEQLNKEGIGPTTTEILLKPDELVESISGIDVPKPLEKYDEGFERDISYFKGDIRFVIKARAKKNIAIRKDALTVNIYLQACDTVRCLPPEELNIAIDGIAAETDLVPAMTYEDHGKQEKPEPKIKASLSESQKEIEKAKKKGIWGFFFFAMAQGALALLTPCVFPMVPITVSFFTKRSEKSKGRGIADSLVYALGIISTFTILGILFALILGPTGIQDFAADPWVNIIIALVFIIFALNLFGAFEIQVPTSVLNKLHAQSQKKTGYGGILLMGLTFSLTSFTCTVPFVGGALFSASGGELFYPVIGMLGFSTMFAAPFFLLALFPSAMAKLPKAGGWMNNIKVVMGFLEIAAALKFISNADLVWIWGLLPREVFLAIAIACSLMIVVYILGMFHMKHDSKIERVGALRVIWSLVFLSFTVYLFTGLLGKPLGELDAFLPPKEYPGQSSEAMAGTIGTDGESAGEETEWMGDLDQALELAKKENKAVFVDFTGWTCTNCRLMEANTFPKEKVAEKMNRMIKVRLYTDRRKEPELSNRKIQIEKFGTIELPFYVIISPDGSIVGTKTFTRDTEGFIDFLQKGLDAAGGPTASLH